jgi:hypothetical protein
MPSHSGTVPARYPVTDGGWALRGRLARAEDGAPSPIRQRSVGQAFRPVYADRVPIPTSVPSANFVGGDRAEALLYVRQPDW